MPVAYWGGQTIVWFPPWIWTYQKPGTFERMQGMAYTRMLAAHLVKGAGHWVQQERPDEVNRILLAFLTEVEEP